MKASDHHLLCLGVLADLYRKHKNTDEETWLSDDDLTAIDEAVESAEEILPVSVERLRQGLPISTEPPP